MATTNNSSGAGISPGDLPDALVAPPRKGPSLVWIVPVVAVVIGLWLVYRTVSETGPTVTISFPDADGIEAGKTKIKYLNVDIGIVNDVQLASSGAKVTLTAEMDRGTETQLTETARFWVVKPRIGVSGISGISTLLSGAYIALDPGQGGDAKFEFEGMPEPPKLLSHQVGTLFRLKAAQLGSISLGSPVYFRDILVGEVVQFSLAEDNSHVGMEVFVNAPHDKIVKSNTRFWNVSGLNIDLSAEGVSVELESFAALLSGGIAFHTPASGAGKPSAPEQSVFPLYSSEKESNEKPIVVTHPYLVYFDDTIRGLSVGAPVEFRGIRIGTVQSIEIRRNREAGQVRIGALLGLEPERLAIDDSDNSQDPKVGLEMAKKLIASGVRVQLKTGNILTGQLFVDMDFFPNAQVAEITMENGIPVLPSVPATLKNLTNQLASIMTKLESLPFAAIGQQAEEAVAGINDLINSGEIQDSVRLLNEVMKSANSFVAAIDDEEINKAVVNLNSTLERTNRLVALLQERAGPILDDVNKATSSANDLIRDARNTAGRAQKALASVETVTAEDGKIGTELAATLQQLRAAARAIRIFVEYLERNPQALVRGK